MFDVASLLNSSVAPTLQHKHQQQVRCIKSNDEKRKDYIDQSRVKFQCKYLGLLENIKVRRAGFAYRSEFHRFHERFKLLSSSTYPRAFRGSDRDACDAIVRDCQSEIPELSDEAQLGKSKIFIKDRRPFSIGENAHESIEYVCITNSKCMAQVHGT